MDGALRIDSRRTTHNTRFVALMDQLMPQSRAYRGQLNQLPVSYRE
jgi:predicted metal-dependent hydrolase